MSSTRSAFPIEAAHEQSAARRPPPEQAGAKAAAQRRQHAAPPRPTAMRRSVRELLASRAHVHRAIILGEILGRPRALQPPDEWL